MKFNVVEFSSCVRVYSRSDEYLNKSGEFVDVDNLDDLKVRLMNEYGNEDYCFFDDESDYGILSYSEDCCVYVWKENCFVGLNDEDVCEIIEKKIFELE